MSALSKCNGTETHHTSLSQVYKFSSMSFINVHIHGNAHEYTSKHTQLYSNTNTKMHWRTHVVAHSLYAFSSRILSRKWRRHMHKHAYINTI